VPKVSQNGPKTKSGEVKFFQIDPEGEIKPAYPDKTPNPTEPEPLWNPDVTPVEWQNEPQAGAEAPEPLWKADSKESPQEPSILLEQPAFSEPTPLLNDFDVQIPAGADSVPSTSPGTDPLNPYGGDENDVPTLLNINEYAPSEANAPAPTPDATLPAEDSELRPAPDIILEDWQEANMQAVGDYVNETTAPPIADSEIPALETPDVSSEGLAYTDPNAGAGFDPGLQSEAGAAPIFESEPDAAPEAANAESSAPVDLSQRFGAQLGVLKRQVQTIHTLGPEKKLNDNQLEVLRKYIALKEAEARDLMDQKRQYQAFLQKLDGQLKSFSKKNQQLVLELDSLKVREEASRKDLLALKEKYKEDTARLKADYEQKLAHSGKATHQASDFDRKREEWKIKIKEELKRIRLKEKDLENKYELLKRDTQALLDSKDQHVLELKRKSDALELEMDTLEEKLRNSNVLLSQMDAKKRRLIETLKLAQVLLEQLDKPDSGNSSSNGA
jgi:hypothetical protein